MTIAEFRQAFLGYVDGLSFSAFYDFLPAEMNDNTAFVIDDIVDKANDSRDGIQPLLFARRITVYCLVKIKNHKRDVAESRGFALAAQVVSAIETTTLSYTLQQRRSIGYTVGQYTYQGAELVFEFYDHD